MASILYNIAALHTKLGIEEGRSDPESMKIACTHFQCAAWAFGEMKNQYASVLKNDIAADLVGFMQQICFAQAQECILEKSLADNRKAAIIAKVTAQVVTFYNEAFTALFRENDEGSLPSIVGSKLFKEWMKYIKFKTSYCGSLLFLYQGMSSEEQRKMGERVTLYNIACEKLEEAKKESKGMNSIETINEALTFTTDVIEGKRKNAKQENEFIYHETIPDISTISAVQGANLVQGIPFDVADPQVIGEDIFKRLVPMKTHEHLSVYSEEKANILRGLGGKIDDRDAELASFMGSLNTESLNAMGQSQEKLPQGLVDRCAEISAKPNAIPDLVESMSNLADICTDVEMTLQEIKRFLDDELKQEQNYQKQMGKRPTGHMTELTREYTKYFEAHNKAGESNDTLRKAMELHVSNLKILAQPLSTLRSQVPQADPIDDITRKELGTLLAKVEEMKKQRDGLYNDLRDQILHKDDITAQLIAHGDKDIEELFKKELGKYTQTVNIIDQNLVAQGNILKALTDTYAKHAMTLKSFNDAKGKREQFYSSLIASFDVYEDLMSKSAKGLDFYKKLYVNVQKLLSRVKAARDVQDEERQQHLKNSMPKAPTESIKSIDTTSYKNMMASVPSSGGGGPKLKDYLKSGMVPGMGGLRDELNKLPVRPSPVGQENVPSSNPASCNSMNYPTSYKSQQNYHQPAADNLYPSQQQMPYYPSTEQRSIHSGSGSLSSSTTSLNNDYYNQSAGYGMPANQGYVNPMYQTAGQQNYQDMTGYSMPDGSASAQNNYANTNNYQAQTGMNQYGNYATNFNQQHATPPVASNQQYDYYKNQATATPQPTAEVSLAGHQQNLSYGSNQSQMNATKQQQQVDQTQSMYQNQYQTPQQYPVTPNSAQQQYSVNQSPAQQQYTPPQSTAQQYPSAQQQYPSMQSSALPQYAATQGAIQQQYSASESLPQQQPQYPPTKSPGLPQQQYANPQNQQPQPYPVAQSPVGSHQMQPSLQQYQNPPVAQQSPLPMQIVPAAPSQMTDQQYSYPQNIVSHHQASQQNNPSSQSQQDYTNQQSSSIYNNSNQPYVMNPYGQYGEQYSQQNYSCYTPTVNSVSSYKTSTDGQAVFSQTTQSGSYHQTPEAQANSSCAPATVQQPNIDSPYHQPHAIPTYSVAVNANSLNGNSEMHMTVSSQQQIKSSTVAKQTIPPEAPIAKPATVKSSALDLLSGIDFAMTNPTIDNIPTLMPVSAKKSVEESPQKVLVPQSPVVAAPVKLNDDLADLDFNSLSVTGASEPTKPTEPVGTKKFVELFEDPAILKQFHKEVESLEKFMETLTIKTLNGVTPLANKWKELQDLLVKDEAKRSVSVARLFPEKNRSVDCLPYDHARVQLPTATDNYINAVLVKDCGPIGFILTQTPMANTVNDYWEMVWSQKANMLVCLHSANEVSFLKITKKSESDNASTAFRSLLASNYQRRENLRRSIGSVNEAI